ncbi:hypothetical protein IT575_13240 [bacterium]|nr:hypothetical protein [bacterium]
MRPQPQQSREVDALADGMLAGPARHWWLRPLHMPLLQIWLALAAYWLLRGALARANALSEGLPELLNEAGLSLWIAGALLAPAFEEVLRRSRQNQGAGGAGGLSGNLLNISTAWPWLAAAAPVLALACLGAFLPYLPGSVLMLAATSDPAEFNLVLLPLALCILLIGGSLALILSCSLHSALRRWLGPGLAFGPWLLAALWLHWHVLSGRDLLERQARGDLSWIDRVPLSLGQQFIELVGSLRSIGNSPPYMNEIIAWVLALLAGMLLLSGALLLLASIHRRVRPLRSRLLPVLLLAGALPPLAALLPELLRWQSRPEIAAPGDWRSLALIGLNAVWLCYWLSLWPRGFDAKAQPANAAWLGVLLVLPLWWLLLSWPSIQAGQTMQSEVLAQGLCSVLLLAPGLSLCLAAQRLGSRWPAWASHAVLLAALALLLLPLDGAERSYPQLLLETLPGALLQPEARPQALLILGLLALIHMLLQLLVLRPRMQRRERPLRPASPAA